VYENSLQAQALTLPDDDQYTMNKFLQSDFGTIETEEHENQVNTGTPQTSRPSVKPRALIKKTPVSRTHPQPKLRKRILPAAPTRGNPVTPVYTDNPAAPTRGNPVTPVYADNPATPTRGNPVVQNKTQNRSFQ